MNISMGTENCIGEITHTCIIVYTYTYTLKFGVKSLFKSYFIKINTIFSLNNTFVNLYFPNFIFKWVTIKGK